MADLRRRTGGRPFHVGECYVWAAISYLDSPTDYREYLARDSGRIRKLASTDIVMLDSLTECPGSGTKQRLASGWIVPTLLLLIAIVFLCLTWYS